MSTEDYEPLFTITKLIEIINKGTPTSILNAYKSEKNLQLQTYQGKDKLWRAYLAEISTSPVPTSQKQEDQYNNIKLYWHKGEPRASASDAKKNLGQKIKKRLQLDLDQS